jgi:hypothetical protein
MKKVSVVFLLLFLDLTFQGFSQTTPKDFFTGPWEIVVYNTPNGDAKMTTTLTRVNGKLTGEFSNSATPTAPKMKITEVVEKPESISILFNAEGMDVNIDLNKKDSQNLEGSLLGMFTAKATRMAKP